MSYVDTIRSIMPLSFDNIIKTAKQHVPDAYQHAPWTYPGLNHGTAILQNEEQLCCYLAAYGEMHKGKLKCALAKFPFKSLDKNFEIIDISRPLPRRPILWFGASSPIGYRFGVARSRW